MLKNYPKEVILKDGSGVTLRPLQKGDDRLLFEMFNRLSEDDRWFLDHDVADFGTIENWVREVGLDRAMSIVAILEGKIIAHATLIRKYSGAKSHIGKIRISVDPSFRERHLGTWMLLDLINLAIAMGLETLIMHLVENRDSSLIRSVKKLDFFERALLKDFVKDREGNLHNSVIMAKRLRRGWEDVGEPT
jgi:GNAT superfamily N-acetyltransferase